MQREQGNRCRHGLGCKSGSPFCPKFYFPVVRGCGDSSQHSGLNWEDTRDGASVTECRAGTPQLTGHPGAGSE